MHLEDPRFPPLLKGHAVRAPAKPFAEACRRLQARKLGAGDLLWSRNTGRAELAIVLEPEVALERALQMGPLMMVALGDCLGALCPPKVLIQYRWPGAMMLNAAAAGEVRVAAARVAPGETPPWLVVGAALQIAAPRGERQDWSATSLAEEAGPEIDRSAILQSLPAHFLTWLNIWQDEGFRPVHDHWMARALGREAPVVFADGKDRAEGLVVGLDEGANLLVKPARGKMRSLAFVDSVELIGQAP
jgi:biotin-(acetyl-CoA carboxylase) ligase